MKIFEFGPVQFGGVEFGQVEFGHFMHSSNSNKLKMKNKSFSLKNSLIALEGRV